MMIDGENTFAKQRFVFLVLFSISIISFFRIGYQFVIVAWHAVQVTDSVAAVGQILLISSVLSLISAPLLGRIIDACVNKRLLLLMGHGGVSLLVAVPLLYSMMAGGRTSFILLSCIAALTGAWGVLSIGATDY